MTKDEVTALSPKAQLSLLSRPGLLRTLEKAPLLASGAGMLRKFVAWTQPVAIKDVKTTGAPHGAKVNHTTLRAMVPVDLRPASHLGQLGNEFGLVILELAVNQALAVRRALPGRSPHRQHVALDTAPGRQLGMAISIMSYKGMATLTVITEQLNIEFQSMLKARVTQSSQSR